MKRLFSMLLSSALTAIIIAGGLSLYSQTGQPPGVEKGLLTPCPDKPNCVCSEYTNDSKHYIKPIVILPEQQQYALSVVKTSIRELEGEIETEQTNYLASTFSSNIFGFIDDVEVRIDFSQNQIHLRSAARVGYSDLGVNKKRTAELKNTINHHLKIMTGTPSDQ